MKPTPDTPHQVIVVAGMHRSGTSALAGVLHQLGAALPKTLMSASPANPRGFFESQAIVDLHEACFDALGVRWNDVGPFPPGAEPAALPTSDAPWAQVWIDRFAATFQEEFAGDAPIVFKDPRICRLIPLWEAAWSRLDHAVEPVYAITVRHPLEVAASLERAYDLPTERALLLWLDHFLSAECATRSRRRCFLTYDDLMYDWRSAISRLDRSLGLELASRAEDVSETIDHFLSADLRNERRSAEELELRPDLPVAVKESYRWSLRAARDEAPSVEILDPLRDALEEAKRAFSPLLRAEERSATEWMERGQEAQAHIETLRDRLESLQRSHSELSARLIDRDHELRRAAEWVRHVLAWGARLRAGEPPPGKLMEPLFQVLAAADPTEVPEFAGAGLRWIDGVYEVKRLAAIVEQRDRELATRTEDQKRQDAVVSALEERLRASDDALATAATERETQAGAIVALERERDELREAAYAAEVLRERLGSGVVGGPAGPLRRLARAARALFGR